jgi:outer membrane protein assembly factor BamB
MSMTCRRASCVPALARIVLMLPLAVWTAVGRAESQNDAASAAFDDFDDEQDYPSEDTLKGLVAPVQGQEASFHKWSHGSRLGYQIRGLFRLNQPWEADSALRFSFLEPANVRFHLWNGQQGVTLAYYQGHHQTWAAYGATREGDVPKPTELVLLATDGGRYRRCGAGTLVLHHHEGKLVLTRGDLTLLSVPFDGPPKEVFIEGHAVVRGLAMIRSPGIPAIAEPRPVAFRSDKPAELNWTLQPPEGFFWNKLPDGRMELFAGEKSPAAQAGTRIVKPGLYEFVFVIDDPGPGTGIYLGNEEGKQLCRLAFFQHKQTKRALFGSLSPGENWSIDRWADVAHQPAPFVGQRQWFRLTVGGGVVKYWTSGDGEHWSQPAPTAEMLEGACTQVGLYCLAKPHKRAIKLARIEVRRLETLMALAPEEIRDRVDVEPLVKAGDVPAWEQLVAQRRPSDVPTDTWWRACLVRTLSENPRFDLGRQLLERLLDVVLAEPGDLTRQLQLLEEVALLAHPNADPTMERLAQRCERLGLQQARQGYSAPFTAISRAMMRLPFWTEQQPRPFSESLLRHELFAKLGEDRLPEVRELCRQVQFWNRTGHPHSNSPQWTDQVKHLAFWGEAQATGQAPKDAVQTAMGPSPWRHPLVVTATREGYNIFGEFTAALQSETYREACQVLSSAAQTTGLGLLPDKDRRLWVSLPVALELAMREHPPLRQAMQEGFGALGELRFKKAAAQGDKAGVTAVTLQFFGTTAARDAHLWLGDRKLAVGRFAEALGHYERATAIGGDAPSEDLLTRQRLAAAMLGRDASKQPSKSVEIGASRLSAAQFEELVGQLRTSRGSHSNEAKDAPPSPCFASGKYQVRPWATVESVQLQRPDPLPDREVDWVGRQTAVTVADGQMFVNNQVDLFAFDLETGRQDWVQRGPSLKSQWPLLPMRPVVAQGRVFVRRLAEANPELACFGRTDGRLLWSCKPDSHVASDPVFVGEDLLILTISEEVADKLILVLNTIDVESGRVRSRVPVAEFYDLWQHRLSLQVMAVDDRIVVVGGGSVLCCDSAGEVRWVRRQVWTPPLRPDYGSAKAWFQQYQEPPLVRDGRVCATQPGSWSVECIDLKSGRLVWRRAVPELTRLVGLARGRMVAETSDGIAGLEADSGKMLWFQMVDDLQHARLSSPDATVLCIQRAKLQQDAKPQLVPVWLDVETGRPRERGSALELPAENAPLLWPLVGERGRQWGFFASGDPPTTKRGILELIPLETDSRGARDGRISTTGKE